MPKLLIVEDNEPNRTVVARRLERRGFELVFAVNGFEAVEMAAAELPDLILMDLSLPKLDGWDATRKIKANPLTSGIPIIALTARAFSDDRASALEAGCDEFEGKPVDFESLMRKIGALLSVRHAKVS